MNESRAKAYAVRFNRVLDYIEQHLDEPLSVDRLCQVANFSRFHFHRQFTEHVGVTVGRYVLLLRLRQASHRLAFDVGAKVIDIALSAGFESPESFTRAFRNAFGQSPSAFRKSPDWERWHAAYRFRLPERNPIMQVDIVQFETTRIAVLEHRGPAQQVNNAAAKFIAWRKETGLSPVASSRTFGIAYDNPDTTEPAQFRFDVAGEMREALPANAYGVVGKTIPGGRCARVRHLGAHARLAESIYPLYRDWLPGSGEELRDFPLFFHYLTLLPHPEADMVTDIYLPLK